MTISRRFAVLVLALTLGTTVFAVNYPPGFQKILTIEKGKSFHPIFPFFIGSSNFVGAFVIAKNPGKPESIFESIDSPRYLKSGVTLGYEDLPISGGDFSETQNIGAAVAFAQLDKLSNAVKTASDASKLLAETCTPTATGKIPNTPASNSGSGNGSASPSAANSSPSKTSAGISDQGESCDQSTLTSTGIDFSSFSGGTLTISKAHILTLAPETLLALGSSTSNPLNPLGSQVLSSKDVWIASSIEVVDSMTYELTSTKSLDAGFFVQLTALT